MITSIRKTYYKLYYYTCIKSKREKCSFLRHKTCFRRISGRFCWSYSSWHLHLLKPRVRYFLSFASFGSTNSNFWVKLKDLWKWEIPKYFEKYGLLVVLWSWGKNDFWVKIGHSEKPLSPKEQHPTFRHPFLTWFTGKRPNDGIPEIKALNVLVNLLNGLAIHFLFSFSTFFLFDNIQL